MCPTANWQRLLLLALLAFWQLQPASATEEAKSVPVPLRYEPCPEFWNEVSLVLKEMVEARSTKRHPQSPTLEDDLRTLTQNDIRSIPLPVLTSYQRVRVYPTKHPEHYSMKSVATTEYPGLHAIDLSLMEDQVRSKSRLTYEKVDFSKELDLYLKAHQQLKGGYSISAKLNEELRYYLEADSQRRALIRDGSHYLNLAYLAYVSGKQQYVRKLIRSALEKPYFSLERFRKGYSWALFNSCSWKLSNGADRERLAKVMLVAAVAHKGQWNQAEELSTQLRAMAEEDRLFTEPEELESLATDEQVQHWIYKLRDAHGVKLGTKDLCRTLSLVVPPFDEWQQTTNPTEQLVRHGFDAVPSLFEALDDTRPTRSYDYEPLLGSWTYPLRICDAAQQTLEVIAGRRFMPEHSSYYSSLPEDKKLEVQGRIVSWWDSVREGEERDSILAKLDDLWRRQKKERFGIRPPLRRLYRLALLDGAEALPEILRWTRPESPANDTVELYRLALQVNREGAKENIEERANPTNDNFSRQALKALLEEGLITQSQFDRALSESTERQPN